MKITVSPALRSACRRHSREQLGRYVMTFRIHTRYIHAPFGTLDFARGKMREYASQGFDVVIYRNGVFVDGQNGVQLGPNSL